MTIDLRALKTKGQPLICVLALCFLALLGSSAAAQSNQQDLSLSGIFHRPGGRSSAIFLLDNKTQKLIAEGRMVSNNIQLLAVEAHRVKISEAGNERWIDLTVERAELNNAPAQLAQTRPAVMTAKAQSQTDSQYRRRVIRLKSGLKRQIADGRSIGFVLRDGGLLDMFHGAALQPDDIIQSINGNGFSSSEDIEDFAYDWRGDAQYRYSILRGGKRVMVQ